MRRVHNDLPPSGVETSGAVGDGDFGVDGARGVSDVLGASGLGAMPTPQAWACEVERALPSTKAVSSPMARDNSDCTTISNGYASFRVHMPMLPRGHGTQPGTYFVNRRESTLPVDTSISQLKHSKLNAVRVWPSLDMWVQQSAGESLSLNKASIVQRRSPLESKASTLRADFPRG